MVRSIKGGDRTSVASSLDFAVVVVAAPSFTRPSSTLYCCKGDNKSGFDQLRAPVELRRWFCRPKLGWNLEEVGVAFAWGIQDCLALVRMADVERLPNRILMVLLRGLVNAGQCRSAVGYQ